MLDMTQEEFEEMIEEEKSPANQVKACVEDMIQQLEIDEMPEFDLGPAFDTSALQRSDSFEPIFDGIDSFEPTGLEGATDEAFDESIFSEPESDVSEEDSDATESDVSEEDSDATESDVSEDEVEYGLKERIGELEEEVEDTTFGFREEIKDKEAEINELKRRHDAEMYRMRQQLERKRDREEVVVMDRPKKMHKSGPSFGDERRGCPFCPFEQTTSGYDMRCLKDHLTNGTCEVGIFDMVQTACTYGNLWCRVDDSGWDCMSKMGFNDPDNHVDEFLHFKCPNCDFRHYHARKFKRHLVAGHNRGGCGFSKVEAEEIKNQQLRRSTITQCKV